MGVLLKSSRVDNALPSYPLSLVYLTSKTDLQVHCRLPFKHLIDTSP